ncbi:DUF4430 domain-containing protein [Metabacillus litoralis]|uniref:DUF4430 domain-containing protein n=1 Tax=Metabacillus litoralis TaxID=152268 RepID=UPI001CFDF72A|nr:DUF4430 domain-containing protein [Metabacillus litoralis]
MKRLNKMFLVLFMMTIFLIACEKDEVVPITESASIEENAEKPSEEKEVAKTDTSENPDKVSKEEQQATTDAELTDKKDNVESENEKQTSSSTVTTKEKEVPTNTSEKSTTNQASKSSTATPEVNETKKSSTTTQAKKTEPEVKTAPKETETKKEKVTPPPVVKKEEPKQTVTITITGDQKKGTVLSSTKVEMIEGNTVLDITLKILKEKGIPVSLTGSGGTAYVQGIANLFEFDRGPLSGWTVKRNGATLDRSAGAVKVKSGDSIQWIYTTDYEEDGN